MSAPASPAPAPAAPERPSTSFWHGLRSWLGIGSFADWIFKLVCQSSSLVIILWVVLIVLLLWLQAAPTVSKLGWSIVTASRWDPNEMPGFPEGQFGSLPFVYGSVITSILAMLIAVPLGVGTAAFLAEIAPGWLRRGGAFLVELLAAIPSVVYGFWGMNFLAPQVVQKAFNSLGGPNQGGMGLLSAGLILAIMVVPYVAAVAYDVCQAVPRAQREGALALGATRWQTIWRVVLPYARPGIVGGCFLALGRAIGETMAVIMVIGHAARVEPLPFGQGDTIPSVIAQRLKNPTSDLERSALIELGLLLFGITILMNVLARVLLWRVGRPRKGPSLWARLRGTRSGDQGAAASPDTAAKPPRPPLPSNARRAAVVNHVMTGVLGFCLVITCVPLFLILGYITIRGASGLSWDFFTQLPKPDGGGGLSNAIAGSAMIVGLSTLFAVPVGILGAIFLAEYRAHRLAPTVRFFGELLTGVPSIIIGTFVYALVRWLIDHDYLRPRNQFSGWAGVLALSIMMLPIVMRATEEALKLVPQALRNASHALGAYHWQTVMRVCVPAALPAIITGTFLAIARIAGETAPLLLTAFGNPDFAFTPSDKVQALPLSIYDYSNQGEKYQQQAWAAALVLLAFVMILNVGIRLLTGKRVVLASRAE
jgi:phosphate transport system permease protein